MRKLIVLTGTIAVVVLSFVSGTATANRSLEVRGAERGVTAESVLTLTEVRRGRATSIICSITLLRTLSRIIPKVNGTSMGGVTGVAVDINGCLEGEAVPNITSFVFLRSTEREECREIGSGRSLCTVDWRLVYEGFLGSLPEITGVLKRIATVRFRIVAGTSCLYRGDAFQLVSISRRALTGARAMSERTIFRGGGFLCPFTDNTFEGTFTVRPPLTIALL